MEEDYQKLIEYSHDIIFRLSPDGIFQYVSPACIALLGYPAGQLIGQPFSKIVHPDSAPLCDTDFREVLKTGQKREGVEYKVRHSDGSWYWHRASLAALHDESGQISGIVGVARDITERNKLIDELKNQKEQFELAIRGSSDGIWVWNILTNELYLSPKLKEQLGYGENELPNTIKAYKKLIHPDDIKNFNKTIRHHVRNSSQLISVEYRILHKNGNYKWIWARGAALRDLNGKVCRIAGSHTDITEKKESDRIYTGTGVLSENHSGSHSGRFRRHRLRRIHSGRQSDLLSNDRLYKGRTQPVNNGRYSYLRGPAGYAGAYR